MESSKWSIYPRARHSLQVCQRRQFIGRRPTAQRSTAN